MHANLVAFDVDPVDDSGVPPLLRRSSGALGRDGDDGGGGDDHGQPDDPEGDEEDTSSPNPKRVVGERRKLLFGQSDELGSASRRLFTKLHLVIKVREGENCIFTKSMILRPRI